MTITSLAFLTPGNYLDDDPYGGLEDTLKLFELGERLGFDGAWIRQRHLEHGVSSGAVFLAGVAAVVVVASRMLLALDPYVRLRHPGPPVWLSVTGDVAPTAYTPRLDA